MLIRTVEPNVRIHRKLKNSPKPPGNELFRRGTRLVGLPVRILRKIGFFVKKWSKNVFFDQKSTFSKKLSKIFFTPSFQTFYDTHFELLLTKIGQETKQLGLHPKTEFLKYNIRFS